MSNYDRIVELSRYKISKLRAAKVLFDEGRYSSVESARAAIRKLTGACGKSGKTKIAWSTDIPTPLESDFGVREIPAETDGIGLLCDLHIPFHDPETIEEFVKMKDQYEVVVIQEVFDFFSLSRFSKHKTIDIVQEQDDFFQLMEWIRDPKRLPDHKIIFQPGNHDDRFWIYIMRQARELEHLQGMEFETIFKFDEFNIEMLPMRNQLHYRGLYIGHGHEINAGGTPVNPARTFALKTKGNYIGGHFHRSSEHMEKNIKDELMGCWSVGCACDLKPLYAPINNWNNGFAIIRPYGDKYFRVKNIKLFK